jgi:hypothetical protein
MESEIQNALEVRKKKQGTQTAIVLPPSSSTEFWERRRIKAFEKEDRCLCLRIKAFEKEDRCLCQRYSGKPSTAINEYLDKSAVEAAVANWEVAQNSALVSSPYVSSFQSSSVNEGVICRDCGKRYLSRF